MNQTDRAELNPKKRQQETSGSNSTKHAYPTDVTLNQTSTVMSAAPLNYRAEKAKTHKLVYDFAFFGPVAQSVEQRIENPCVGGSIPPRATKVQRPTVLGWAFCFWGAPIYAGHPPVVRVSTRPFSFDGYIARVNT